MMTAVELNTSLARLAISPDEAAQLLGVSGRTLRRWIDGEAVPTPAEAALRAWIKLNEWGIPWKPDSASIAEDDREQIFKMREHAIDVDGMIQRVKGRGGPADHWTVDFGKGIATFGPMQVGFYGLKNGGFSLSSYTRRDDLPDVRRDAHLIEDAAYCIAADYVRHGEQREALSKAAAYVRANGHLYAQSGSRMHTQAERAPHVYRIHDVGFRMEGLANAAGEHRAGYGDFQRLLDELHGLGFYLELDLVSEVARAFH